MSVETPAALGGARILALLDAEQLPARRVIELAERCADSDRTLVATTRLPLFGSAGLEGLLGDDAIVALFSGP